MILHRVSQKEFELFSLGSELYAYVELRVQQNRELYDFHQQNSTIFHEQNSTHILKWYNLLFSDTIN